MYPFFWFAPSTADFTSICHQFVACTARRRTERPRGWRMPYWRNVFLLATFASGHSSVMLLNLTSLKPCRRVTILYLKITVLGFFAKVARRKNITSIWRQQSTFVIRTHRDVPMTTFWRNSFPLGDFRKGSIPWIISAWSDVRRGSSVRPLVYHRYFSLNCPALHSNRMSFRL